MGIRRKIERFFASRGFNTNNENPPREYQRHVDRYLFGVVRRGWIYRLALVPGERARFRRFLVSQLGESPWIGPDEAEYAHKVMLVQYRVPLPFINYTLVYTVKRRDLPWKSTS